MKSIADFFNKPDQEFIAFFVNVFEVDVDPDKVFLNTFVQYIIDQRFSFLGVVKYLLYSFGAEFPVNIVAKQRHDFGRWICGEW